ncbi:hypothetical protein EDC04DRAFT_2585116 [Pisolithus marmoratus]|nr:hypothetical protein EDC04DRAFT_2585116 [Pisolithus marmoratus]
MSQTATSQLIISNFVDTIRPPFEFIVGVTALSSCLVTLLVILFLFSTHESRRRPVFCLNVIAISTAVVLSILTGITSGRAIFDPFSPTGEGIYVATIFFAIFPPVFYDSILLTRLLALYPVNVTPGSTLFKMFIFPVCIKCSRLISLYLREFVQSTKVLQSLEQHAQATWYRNPYITAEWTMQMLDNLYSVSIFLYNLHTRTSRVKYCERRIQQIVFISVTNFVLPLFLNAVQIVCITTSHSFATGTMVLLTNNYVSVIGVLCATIWFSGSEWVRNNQRTTVAGTLQQCSEQGKAERFMVFRSGSDEMGGYAKPSLWLLEADREVLGQCGYLQGLNRYKSPA